MLTDKLQCIHLEQTCESYPSQWNATVRSIEDGREYKLYIRYRSRYFYAKIVDGFTEDELKYININGDRSFICIMCLPDWWEESTMSTEAMKALLQHQIEWEVLGS